MTEPVLDTKVRDLAEKIYVDLVGRIVDVSVKPMKVTADPAAVATASFKLAAVFLEIQERLNQENQPKSQSDFKLDLKDLAAWSK